jgi:hypothetical protein|tara:strand:- start:597 stop:758 length:162 start_codon:yes stop_codon:yes gene_type:complete
MSVRKFEVGFDGYVTVFASSYGKAKEMVEKDLKTLHPKYHAEFTFISKIGEEE